MKTPVRSSFHHLLVARPGIRRSTSRASASAALRTSVKSCSGTVRMKMWMPRLPEVFGKPSRPCSRSTSCTPSATALTSAKGTSGWGSRSTRSSSGWSRSARRTAQGFQSITPRLTPQSRWAASFGTSSRAWRPLGKVTVAVCSHSGAPCGTRFWKNGSPATPSTQRLRTVGRSRRPRMTACSHSR